MKRRIRFLLLFLIGTLAVWYFFIKKYDHQYTFNVATPKGVVFQKINDWTTSSIASIDSVVTRKKIAFKTVQQHIWISEKGYRVNWEINDTNDSVTKVKIGVNLLEGGVADRFQILIGNNPIKDSTLEAFKNFREYLNNFLTATTVSDTIIHARSPEHWCAYVALEGDIASKANKMMANTAFITAFLSEEDIALAGNPYLEVLDWDLDSQRIKYNFCFPIDVYDNLPHHETIKFKKTKSYNSLKIKYFGNYRYSDRAWYELIEYAENNALPVSFTPLEVYLNNPITDGNERSWEAEVFMPVQTD